MAPMPLHQSQGSHRQKSLSWEDLTLHIIWALPHFLSSSCSDQFLAKLLRRELGLGADEGKGAGSYCTAEHGKRERANPRYGNAIFLMAQWRKQIWLR